MRLIYGPVSVLAHDIISSIKNRILHVITANKNLLEHIVV